MRFRCERDTLVDMLQAAGRAVGRRSGSLPVLASLHLVLEGDTLTVEGTDLEVSISMSGTVAGEADGVCAIPARILTDTVRSLPVGAVTVELADVPSQVTISAARSSFVLRTADEAEYPRLQWADDDGQAIPGKELLAAIERVTPAASTDDSRPILCGVLLERRDGDVLRLVATDSYRLTLQDLPHGAALGAAERALVPADALKTLAKVAGKGGEVTVALGERSVFFSAGPLRVQARLIEGDFPNYGGLIPKAHPGKLVASRSTLIDDVKRAQLLARESTPVRIKLGGGDGTLQLGAMTQDVGTATIGFDAGYTGPEMEVGFNPGYLLDALEACPGDEVHLDVLDSKNPAVLRSPADDSFLALLMPVRTS